MITTDILVDLVDTLTITYVSGPKIIPSYSGQKFWLKTPVDVIQDYQLFTLMAKPFFSTYSLSSILGSLLVDYTYAGKNEFKICFLKEK